jgi:hypothetical protein
MVTHLVGFVANGCARRSRAGFLPVAPRCRHAMGARRKNFHPLFFVARGPLACRLVAGPFMVFAFYPACWVRAGRLCPGVFGVPRCLRPPPREPTAARRRAASRAPACRGGAAAARGAGSRSAAEAEGQRSEAEATEPRGAPTSRLGPERGRCTDLQDAGAPARRGQP